MSVALRGALALWGLVVAAPAGAGTTVVGIGNGVSVNDPFMKSFLSPELSVEYRFTRYFGVTALAAWRPSLGDADFNALTTSLQQDWKISPDLSRVDMDGRLGIKFLPAHAPIGEHAVGSVGVQFGLGTIHSEDQLSVMFCEGEPVCQATEKQWHMTAFYGISGEVLWKERYGLRLRMDRVRHIETVMSTVLEMKTRQLVSADFLLAF